MRAKIMKSGAKMGSGAAAKALDVDEGEDTEELKRSYSAAHFDTDDLKLRELDLSMKTVSDGIQNDITKLADLSRNSKLLLQSFCNKHI